MVFGGNNKGGRGPIGIAVSAHEVRLAQRVGAGFVFEREALAEGVDPTGADFHAETSRAIAVALRRGSFSGKQVVSALPAQMLCYKTLRMPPMPEEDLTAAIAWEAADRFQFNEDKALQHYSAGQVQQGNETREEVILLAVDKAAVQDHAVALKRAGLTPIAIDATGAAMTRVLGGEGGSTLVINLDSKYAEIVAARNGQVIFDKPIEITHTPEGIDTVSLAREIGLCLRYLSVTFGMHKPDTAWVCGEGVTGVLAQTLSEALPTAVQLADQSPAMLELDCPGPDRTMWVVPLGLSLRDPSGQAQRGAA